MLRPLQETFADAPAGERSGLLVGLASSDDAAVYRPADGLAVVQTLDFFPPLVDDPYDYGRIAAANAMSDVYAMGGEVRLALNIAAFPDDLDPALLAEIFRGGADKVREAGGVVAGGHTLIAAEPLYGLAVTGEVDPAAVLRADGARPGDALLLTKPLGTGVLLGAARQGAAEAADLAAAVDSMQRLNREPARLAREAGAHAATDVTGFGLAGHAAEMAEGSGAAIAIDLAALPLLSGAARAAADGFATGGGGRNRGQLGGRVRADGADPALAELFYDPQTSGGLLIALPEAAAEPLRRRIEERTGGCWRVGGVGPATPGAPPVTAR